MADIERVLQRRRHRRERRRGTSGSAATSCGSCRTAPGRGSRRRRRSAGTPTGRAGARRRRPDADRHLGARTGARAGSRSCRRSSSRPTTRSSARRWTASSRLEQRRGAALRLHAPRRRSAGTPASSIPPGRKDEIDDGPASRSATAGRSSGWRRTRLRKDGSARRRVGDLLADPRRRRTAIVGVSAISRDITQLVRARQEIAEREERIRLLLDSTAEAIYGIDLSGVCIFCNSACARLLGYDSPAALDRQADAPADPPHQAGRHAVSAGAVADLRGDAASRGQRTSTTK